MNELKIFENSEFGKIRTLFIGDEPYFVGVDVASILAYKEPNKAINKHIDVDDRTKYPITDKIGRKQATWIINESGLYSLILSSRLPQAKAFKKWVTSEVLPSIRKHGGYIQNQENLSREELLARALIFANSVIDEKEKRINQLELANKLLAEEVINWDNRAILNKLIRAYANKTNLPHWKVWNMLYDELLYKHHIKIKSRGKKPFIQHIRDDEWGKVMSSMVALCEREGVEIGSLIYKDYLMLKLA